MIVWGVYILASCGKSTSSIKGEFCQPFLQRQEIQGIKPAIMPAGRGEVARSYSTSP